MSLPSMVLRFFEPKEDCPDEIPNCSQLREQYMSELNKINNSNSCISCATTRLKSKYINLIINNNLNK